MKSSKLLTNSIVLVILIAVGFGCKSINMPSLGGGGESADPKVATTTAYKKFMEAKYYHSVTKSKNSMATVETEMDFNAPDRFWIVNKLPNMKSEVIVIGNDSYNRMNEGKWSKMATSLPISEMRGKMTDESFALMKDFESAGKESLNGKEAFVYKFKSSFGGESSSKMWVSAETGLPLRVDTDGSYSGTKIQISITYDYEKETKIDAPKIN